MVARGNRLEGIADLGGTVVWEVLGGLNGMMGRATVSQVGAGGPSTRYLKDVGGCVEEWCKLPEDRQARQARGFVVAVSGSTGSTGSTWWEPPTGKNGREMFNHQQKSGWTARTEDVSPSRSPRKSQILLRDTPPGPYTLDTPSWRVGWWVWGAASTSRRSMGGASGSLRAAFGRRNSGVALRIQHPYFGAKVWRLDLLQAMTVQFTEYYAL